MYMLRSHLQCCERKKLYWKRLQNRIFCWTQQSSSHCTFCCRVNGFRIKIEILKNILWIFSTNGQYSLNDSLGRASVYSIRTSLVKRAWNLDWIASFGLLSYIEERPQKIKQENKSKVLFFSHEMLKLVEILRGFIICSRKYIWKWSRLVRKILWEKASLLLLSNSLLLCRALNQFLNLWKDESFDQEKGPFFAEIERCHQKMLWPVRWNDSKRRLK